MKILQQETINPSRLMEGSTHQIMGPSQILPLPFTGTTDSAEVSLSTHQSDQSMGNSYKYTWSTRESMKWKMISNLDLLALNTTMT